MYSIIVVPPPTTENDRIHTRTRFGPTLAERPASGPTESGDHPKIPRERVSRGTGGIARQSASWTPADLPAPRPYTAPDPTPRAPRAPR